MHARRTVALVLSLSLATSGLLAGCGDDTGDAGGTGVADSTRPTCDELGDLCHDTTSELGQECHELGHDEANTEADCEAREEECRGECVN